MAIEDVESGEATKLQCLQEPFIQPEEAATYKEVGCAENGSIGMVLLSTLVAVCGSFTFGTCVSIYLKPYCSCHSLCCIVCLQ